MNADDEPGLVRSGRCRFERCPACGTPTHVHPGIDGREIALQPGNFPSAALPRQIWRHLSRGIVYLGADAREYGTVRIEHDTVCPAWPEPEHRSLADMWRALAVRAAREREGDVPGS